MAQGRLLLLDDFAYAFLSDKRHYSEVRADDLADEFRTFFNLPLFPSIADLTQLCGRLGIPIKPLPAGLGDVSGLNTWSEREGHEIFLSESVTLVHYQHTLCHELREVLEQTFARTHPNYTAMNTHDNKIMNPASDRFAACLLMAGEASRGILREMGFDVVRFASEKVRSLASVIMRTQELFSITEPYSIVGGVWLFERDWDQRDTPGIAMHDMRLQHRAHLGGFSVDKRGPAHARAARGAFPTKGSRVDGFEQTTRAFGTRRPYLMRLGGFDLFHEQDYIVGAEPLMRGPLPMRIVMTAVQTKYERVVAPWMERLSVDTTQIDVRGLR